MDDRTKLVIDALENHTLGLNDTFQFGCRACGKCCKNRDDILLTTRDLYSIAAHLSRTMEYVITRYCEIFIGETSRVPIVRLKPCGEHMACPLLRGRRCIVHGGGFGI